MCDTAGVVRTLGVLFASVVLLDEQRNRSVLCPDMQLRDSSIMRFFSEYGKTGCSIF